MQTVGQLQADIERRAVRKGTLIILGAWAVGFFMGILATMGMQ